MKVRPSWILADASKAANKAGRRKRGTRRVHPDAPRFGGYMLGHPCPLPGPRHRDNSSKWLRPHRAGRSNPTRWHDRERRHCRFGQLETGATQNRSRVLPSPPGAHHEHVRRSWWAGDPQHHRTRVTIDDQPLYASRIHVERGSNFQGNGAIWPMLRNVGSFKETHRVDDNQSGTHRDREFCSPPDRHLGVLRSVEAHGDRPQSNHFNLPLVHCREGIRLRFRGRGTHRSPEAEHTAATPASDQSGRPSTAWCALTSPSSERSTCHLACRAAQASSYRGVDSSRKLSETSP